jgi:hypothetical protein
MLRVADKLIKEYDGAGTLISLYNILLPWQVSPEPIVKKQFHPKEGA